MEIDLAILGQVATESDIKGEVVLDLIERLVLAESELEAIKNQEATKYSIEFVVNNEKLYFASDSKDFHCQFLEDDHGNEHRAVAAHPLYAKPVYQHSFTVDGHTFYADNEVDILYLERKFGVGGKAKLNLVEDK